VNNKNMVTGIKNNQEYGYRFIQQLHGHEKLEIAAIYIEVNTRKLQEIHARCHPAGLLASVTGTV